jgi:precorrin-2/cobalt-factor-2 C20-methyltransferase
MVLAQTGERGMSSGCLIGVGTGPGDPQLVTRRAWTLVENASVIAYPAPDSGTSFARSIVAEAISEDAIEIPMIVPMRPGRAPAQSIYDDAAATIGEHLAAGHDVVVLCEGDPLFYGSFMYLLVRLKESHPVEIVPGVTSLSACAAAQARPLVARSDVLSVLPGTMDNDALAVAIVAADAVAIMKVGRHMPRLRALLHRIGLADTALYTSHASLPHERALPLAEAPDEAPYFSMILIYKGDDPWIR